jgi:hypothetical protein
MQTIKIVRLFIICLFAFKQKSQHSMFVLAQNCKFGISSRINRSIVFVIIKLIFILSFLWYTTVNNGPRI